MVMNTVALQRSRLAGLLSTLSVDDMVWVVKFLKNKLVSRTGDASYADNASCESATERERTERFLTSVYGTWDDDKDADEMVSDIYGSRVNRNYGEMEKLFE